MQNMDKRGIRLPDVLNHDLILNSRQEIQQLLARAATSSGSRAVVAEKLAQLGVQHTGEKDVLDSVPEIKTQVKRKVGSCCYHTINRLLSLRQLVKTEVDGEMVNKELFEVPYNLGVLRESLGQIIQGRKALPDDVLQRQKIIEETAYDSALARFQHEADVFKEMNMGGNLGSKNMKVWMWEWYNTTAPYLQQKIAELKEDEEQCVYTIYLLCKYNY